ncbi:MAG: hypothetical protein OSA44_09485 [Nitrospinaceae bacterium]|nr:hypothetical protein [Nitrospinaceae bacterium]
MMIRRGETKVTNVSSQNLITFIRRKVLLGTDELSGDGKNWIRVDRHYQLRKYFPSDEEGPATMELAGKPKPGDYIEVGELSPDHKGNLEEAADLLKDING